jgi:NAD(P)-dependent dehydrogenase (short-subunit alcohol dehydrogenase family)
MKTGRIVVVTGAAGGMGALIVRRFLSNGDAVIATDTEESALARLRSAEGHGHKLLTFARAAGHGLRGRLWVLTVLQSWYERHRSRSWSNFSLE